MKKQKYQLAQYYGPLGKGAEVYEFFGNTFGLVSDETKLLNQECIAVTSREADEYPFFVVPRRILKPI